MKRFSALLLLIWLLNVAPSLAGQNNARIDRWHSWVCTNLVESARRMDYFFSNDLVREEENDTRLRVSFGPEFRDRGESVMRQRVSLRLHLPQFEERMSFFVEEIADDVLDVMMGEGDDERARSGLRVRLRERKHMKSDISGSVRLSSGELDPYVRLRSRWSFPLESWLFEPTQFLFWRRQVGFGMRSRLDIIRPLTESQIVRLRTQGTWTENVPGVDWLVEPGYFFKFHNGNGFNLSGYVDGKAHAENTRAEVYKVKSVWRQRIYRDWLFLEAGPDVRWRRIDDFRTDPGFTILLEINAGR